MAEDHWVQINHNILVRAEAVAQVVDLPAQADGRARAQLRFRGGDQFEVPVPAQDVEEAIAEVLDVPE